MLAPSFRCPYCHTGNLPRVEKKLSGGGQTMLVVLLICCFPIFWLPLLTMREERRRCVDCGMRLG